MIHYKRCYDRYLPYLENGKTGGMQPQFYGSAGPSGAACSVGGFTFRFRVRGVQQGGVRARPGKMLELLFISMTGPGLDVMVQP